MYKALLLITLVVWLGGMFFFSVVAAPAIFKTLPREQAGDVVGAVFPLYFKMTVAAGAVSFILLLTLASAEGKISDYRPALALLAVATVFSAGSAFYVGPKAREIKIEYRAMQDGGEKEARRAIFRKWHAVSSVINLAVMISGFVAVILIGIKIRF